MFPFLLPSTQLDTSNPRLKISPANNLKSTNLQAAFGFFFFLAAFSTQILSLFVFLMVFGSETIPRDTRRNSGASFLFSGNSKHVSGEGEVLRSKEQMGSDNLFGNQNQNQPQQIQQSCGLMRYRSAPGSFLATLLEPSAENSGNGDESEAFFCALMDNGPLDLNQKDNEEMEYFTKQEDRSGKYSGEIVGSYSVGMENQVHVGMNISNLGRQSSSPAEFYSGFGIMGEAGNFRVHNNNDSNSSSTGLINRMKFSSPPSSTSRFMPSIPENGNETHDSENGRFRNSKEFEPPSTQDSWNGHPPLNGFKRIRDGEQKLFSNLNGLGYQNEETRKRSRDLVRHLSLPKSSAQSQMAADVQKFLHFQQDTTPCQIRAKRGFATHPRSIAERMRRTRISEKMKKLQDLFPNMDRQTNTADMLDLAVEHIKDLQKQVMTLSDARAKCVCSSKPKATSATEVDFH